MKRVYVNEEWCLGCHLCEYNCGFANSGETSMIKAYHREQRPLSRIRVEDGDDIHFAVNCRHCKEPLCVKGCITGALSVEDGVVKIDQDQCIGCRTCIAMCPYGCLVLSHNHTMLKCELCLENSCGEPACVAGCPNRAIVYEERG